MSRDEYQLKKIKNSHAEASGDFRDSHRLSFTSLPGISLNMVYLGVWSAMCMLRVLKVLYYATFI